MSGKVTELPHPSTSSLDPALSGVEGWGTRGVLSRATGRICRRGHPVPIREAVDKNGRKFRFGLDLPQLRPTVIPSKSARFETPSGLSRALVSGQSYDRQDRSVAGSPSPVVEPAATPTSSDRRSSSASIGVLDYLGHREVNMRTQLCSSALQFRAVALTAVPP